MTKQELLDKANDLPLAPGVYLMMDKTGCVIYVGKAKKLKNRVSQYFQENSSHNEKTRRMVSQVDHFDTIFVSTEFEALILENSLIKQHMPRYNILLKDDKGYPFVRLGTEHYPRFTMVGKPADDNALYFGPFGGRNETRAAIDAICAAFRLPTCSRKFPRDIGKERPCLNHHMGRCDAFCRGTPDEDEYMRRIGQAEELLNGHYRRLTRALREEMEQEAAALHFEQAAALRDRIRAIEVLGKRQKVIAGICADTDIWGVYRGALKCGSAVLHIEDGSVTGRDLNLFAAPQDESEQMILSALLPQYYLNKSVLPREILLPCEIEGAAELITEQAHPDADITWGIAFDENMDDEMMITVIATGFEDKPKSAVYPEEQPKTKVEAPAPAQTEYVQTSITQPVKPEVHEEPKKEEAPYIAKRPTEINPDDEFSIILDSFNR